MLVCRSGCLILCCLITIKILKKQYWYDRQVLWSFGSLPYIFINFFRYILLHAHIYHILNYFCRCLWSSLDGNFSWKGEPYSLLRLNFCSPIKEAPNASVWCNLLFLKASFSSSHPNIVSKILNTCFAS